MGYKSLILRLYYICILWYIFGICHKATHFMSYLLQASQTPRV
jgi:hypothetical protein